MSLRTLRLAGLGLVVGTLSVASACGSASDGGGGGAASGGGGSGGGGTSGVGGGGTSGTGAGGSGGAGGIDIDGSQQDVPLTPDSGCATETAKADQIPLNIFVVLDVSGSMVNLGHWPNVKPGLIDFFSDPQSAGLRVALTYFPKQSPLTCDPADYVNPEVPLAPLTADMAPTDTQEQALIDSLNANTPVSGQYTPMYGGLGGGLQAAKNYMTANPTQKAAVILVTDGIPEANYCNASELQIANIAALASQAFGSAPSVLTFCLGLQGSNEADLNTIATSGGGSAFFLGSGSNAKQLLIDALKSISGTLLACEYSMPVPEAGTIDPTKVNVDFKPSSGSPVNLFKVDDLSKCVPNAWYYDNNSAPTKIILCPDTCTTVQGDPNAEIQIVLGCASRIPA